VLIPTVFAPLTGTLFQTASQAAMVGVGVAASMAGAAAAPVAGAAGAGLGGAGAGGLGSLAKGVSGGIGQAPQTIGQQAASNMQSMGLGERLLYAAPHSLKNVALVGTTGLLTAMGASGAAKSIATVAPLSSSSAVSTGIGRINSTRQQASLQYETSTALQDANQALGVHVFNAVTESPPNNETLQSQAPALTQWYERQVQMSPPQFLSMARRSHIVTVSQYQAIARSPGAQSEFTEGYKAQLDAITKYDESGRITPSSLGELANLRTSLEPARVRSTKSGSDREQTA
jgi:hypothetical protein